MGAIHRVIPDDRPGQVWWFHGTWKWKDEHAFKV